MGCYWRACSSPLAAFTHIEGEVRAINSDLGVKGELGYIGAGSEIHDTIPESLLIFTTPAGAWKFAEATEVRILAPAVGNMHRLIATMREKRLDLKRIARIEAATGVPMTLHGGSATDDASNRGRYGNRPR